MMSTPKVGLEKSRKTKGTFRMIKPRGIIIFSAFLFYKHLL